MLKGHVRSQKAITLIALVVTIIVLLILAAVSISAIVGENGIATKAQNSSVAQDRANILEKLQVEVLDENIDTEGESFEISQYLLSKGYIDENNVVDTEKLLGKKLKTGNGTGKTDVYTVELEGDGYKLIYYENESKRIVVGKIGKTIHSFEYTQADIDETLKYFTFNETTGELASMEAEYTQQGGNSYYYREFPKKVVIPKEINGVKVTSITGTSRGYNGPFAYASDIEELIILAEVSDVGYFYGCTNLRLLYLSSTVSLDSNQIHSMGTATLLEEVIIENENSVHQSIEGAIYTKSGEALVLCPPKKLSINIPSTVSNIDGLFYGSSLEKIEIEEENATYKAINNIVYSDAGDVLIFAARKLTSASILNTVVIIENSAFAESSIRSIDIPNSVNTIGEYAFSNCEQLSTITIGNSVTTINSYAFERCNSLKSIIIPNSVTTIDYYAFGWCEGLTNVYCYASSKPSEWNTGWLGYNDANISIAWGYAG